jgi:hypothetical protein
VTIPVSTRSPIYGGRTVRGFFLSRWFATTPHEEVRSAPALVDKAVMVVPEGRPVPADRVRQAVDLAEAPDRGGKPLLVF